MKSKLLFSSVLRVSSVSRSVLAINVDTQPEFLKTLYFKSLAFKMSRLRQMLCCRLKDVFDSREVAILVGIALHELAVHTLGSTGMGDCSDCL